MSKVIIKIDTSNDAFGSNLSAVYYDELRRILRVLCNACSEGRLPAKLRDINGNTVGSVQVRVDAEDVADDEPEASL